MYPLAPLQAALYSALTQAVTTTQGAPLPVVEFVPAGFAQPQYALLDPRQWTVTPTRRAQGCRLWEVTGLLDLVTLFAPGAVNSDDANELAAQAAALLDGNRLPLAGGYQVVAAEVSVSSGYDFDNEAVDVHRYLRLRYSIELNS